MVRRPHPNPNVLLVEGVKEQRVIPYLIDANGICWGNTEKEWIARIEPLGGIEKLLAPGVISSTFKASGVKTVGIVVDADDDLDARWQSIRNRAMELFPDAPKEWPGTPIITDGDNGQRLGVWIMPDNNISGMLESFLQYLAPTETEELLHYAREVCAEAASRGAKFKDAHRAKAEIYTWLAWQDEPGRQLHEAIHERILHPASPQAADFVKWFRNLFGV